MAKKKGASWEKFPPMQDTLHPGQVRLPKEEWYEEGTVLWAIGDPPCEVKVVRDTGHPLWLQITGEDGRTWEWNRKNLRTTRKRALLAMAAQLRKNALKVLKRVEEMGKEARS
jgi:hypothetical protein